MYLVAIVLFFVLILLSVKDPDLLAKRLNTKEREKPQKIYVLFSIFICLITYVIPGLDFRFHWSRVPILLVWLSAAGMLTGYFLFVVVMRQNSYASRVIEIQQGQKLIDTGLYSVVRHPMYMAATLLFGFSPLVLGSFYGLLPAVFIPIALVIRIMNEEKVLREGLPGYEAYMQKVRFRLIPYIW
jgi:protein-S-isoprenylcysteine O-methyltransferase Ste14